MTLLTIFSDHSSLVSTRRALLVATFTTIVLSVVSVEGNGIEILGLTFSTDFENLVTVSKLLLGYFCLVYFGYAVEPVLAYVRNIWLSEHQKQAEEEIAKAQEIIDDFNNAMRRYDYPDRYDDDDDGPVDPEDNGLRIQAAAREKLENQKVIVDLFFDRTTAFLSYFLNVFLALMIALSVLFLPTETLKSQIQKVEVPIESSAKESNLKCRSSSTEQADPGNSGSDQ